jgi:hypothetical protein
MTDFRALCAELHAAFNTYAVDMAHHDLLERARAALAEQPVGLTDEKLLKLAAKELCYEFDESWFLTGRNCPNLNTNPCELLNFARAVLAAAGSHPTPIPVAERLPGPEDCIQRGNDHWCWGQERSFLTGQAAARWRMMRVSSLEDEAVGWLPVNALLVPAND